VHSHLDRMRKKADVKQFNLEHFPEIIADGAERADPGCGWGGGCVSRGGQR